MDSGANKTVEQYIQENPVMMFSKSYCPFCDQAKQLLKSKGIEFFAIEMDQMQGGDELHKELKAFSGQNTVPNTYIGGKHLGGCDDTKAAEKSGKLKELCDAAGVAHKM